ncbi:alpha/beta fold hydrolase [Ferrimonas aestuarii]|uniref:Alpha/beta hydrolase n=1 Tax=Ferrimonas aestuarii TaxID=2569539 RepID=A0A4U1BPN3_9GAMM|nr:alpha/beta hydrolase [Ferrimonas aestuarii]TKB55512.1 alpha/beta hydrolase [Ferrimonas aestuarii]
MKKKLTITLGVVLLLLSPILYIIYALTMTGPMPDDEFQKQLPTIVSNLETKIEGDGEEALVMIHGYPDSLELWDKQAEYFKKDYTVARFTLPGFELNDSGERPSYSIKQIRMITDEFIKRLNKDKVTVLAHDWGAVYAFKYLEQNDLVDRVVLFDIGSFGKEERPAINVKYTFALAVAWNLPESLGEKLALYTAGSILNITDVDPNKTVDDLRPDPRMTYPYYHLWNAVLTKSIGKSAEVEEYATPFLFLYGKDKKVWFHAKTWEQQVVELGKGQVDSLPGGHWFMQSSPDLVNQKVEAWLTQGQTEKVANLENTEAL